MSCLGEDDENGGEKDCYRLVALDDWECQNKVVYEWVEDVMDSLEKFGWSSGMVEKLDVSLGKVGYMLRDCAWPEVNKAWMMEAGEESDGRCTWV